MGLESPITTFRGLTKSHKSALAAMGIATVRDLLYHFPFRHEDYSARVPISALRAGEDATVVAKVERIANRQAVRQRGINITEAVLSDGHGKVTAVWFNQPFITKYLLTGETYRFAGKLTSTKFGLRLSNPIYGEDKDESKVVNPFMPVYPLSSGISQHVFRRLVRQSLVAAKLAVEHLPERHLEQYRLMSLPQALTSVHFPDTAEELAAARRRLAFDELLKIQLAMGRTKKFREARSASAVPFDKSAVRAFVSSLPFELTGDQKRAAWEAIRDMERGVPMNRLLDGDVGSGKTAVAAVVAVNAAKAGHQTAIMAPTEILALQHYRTLARMFGADGPAVALWTNAYKRLHSGGEDAERRGKAQVAELAEEIAAGRAAVIVGTHALVEKTLSFCSLALAVIDEQHRFGVRTRRLLCDKGGAAGEPHLLSMTATPIPRSLALTVYGDLDLSLLKEKPKGRQPIVTRTVPPNSRATAYARVRLELEAGRQAFVVCPLIDPSDMLGVASVTEEFNRLQSEVFPTFKLGMLHGKMSAAEKEEAMRAFKERETHVLVSTSVVEVGVDVPNATVMCIEGADRFGLAQLHQFRGRVGRGEHKSCCYLFPSAYGNTVRERLRAMEETDDGFVLAEKDLAMRGPGDILGDDQSGHFPALQALSVTDMNLVHDARVVAREILDEDPELSSHPALRALIGESVEAAHLE